ncbi:unnamed protein product [Schistosoma turkestanicum]|nr:unnamed protein product [Schistosoma turkestanicum]
MPVTECFVCKIVFCDQDAYWKHVYEDDCHNPHKTSSVNSNSNENDIQKPVQSMLKISNYSVEQSSTEHSDAFLKKFSSNKVDYRKVPIKRNPSNNAYCDTCQTYMTPFDLTRHKAGKKHLKMLEKANSFVPVSGEGYQYTSFSTYNHQTNPLKVKDDCSPNINPCSVTNDFISSCMNSSSDSPVKQETDSQYTLNVQSPSTFIGTSENRSNKLITKSILRRLCMTEISSLLTQMVGDMDQNADFYRQIKTKCRNDLNSILNHEIPILKSTFNQELPSQTKSSKPTNIYHNENTSLSQMLLFWVRQLHALNND